MKPDRRTASYEERMQAFMARKIAAVRRERAQLDLIEKNVKHVAKRLGIKLT